MDEYIAKCPAELWGKLQAVRAAIRQVAPDAIETVSFPEEKEINQALVKKWLAPA